MFFFQIVFILVLILMIYNIIEIKKFNKNGIIVEYENNFINELDNIKNTLKQLNPVLINVKNSDLNIDSLISKNLSYNIDDLGYSMKKINDSQNIRIIKNKNIFSDLCKDKIYFNNEMIHSSQIPLIKQESISLLKGYQLLPLEYCKHNYNIIYILEGEITIFLFNPKHKQEILGKSLESIKKYAHKYHLKSNNLLVIPTNWYYIQESTDNVLEYHCNSDNIFCVLYNMIR